MDERSIYLFITVQEEDQKKKQKHAHIISIVSDVTCLTIII